MGLLSLNDRAARVVAEMMSHAGELNVEPLRVAGSATVIDAGVNTLGSINAGLAMARICLADLADVSLVPWRVGERMTPAIAVNVWAPLAACMASQYAGWQIAEGDFFGMGSGPMRAVAAVEKLYDEIGFKEKPKQAIGVIETSTVPTQEVLYYMAGKLQVPPERITLVVARTASMAGGVQVVARSVETAMHKLHELKFDLSRIVAGYGVAPMPPVAKNDLKAIGRTNDAVLYGGEVTLMVKGDDASIDAVGEQLPSSASNDYGKPFGEVFKAYDGDFYKIDPMLFSPAVVTFQNVETGRAKTFGQLNTPVLEQSFFG